MGRLRMAMTMENNLKRWPFLDLKYCDNDESVDNDGETRMGRLTVVP